ncbi:MAG: putative inorganic carbon transporter subunit DabA, partial [Pseudomonadota bacterium]
MTDHIAAAAEAAGRHIPPVWPLATSVAVNPFLGQAEATLAEVAGRLGRVAGVQVTMPRSWYRARIEAGEILKEDLAAALGDAPGSVAELRAAATQDRAAAEALPTVADLVAREGVDWPGLIADRIGVWAAGYFDQGQALWAAPVGASCWAAYCAQATHDLTPEIMGLRGFARFVADAPQDPEAAIARAVARLDLPPEALETYFHQLLLSLGGWAQVARYRLWTAELAEVGDATLRDLLAIRLLWEEALFAQHEATVGAAWEATRQAHATPPVPSADDRIDAMLQEAAERAAQRRLAETLAAPAPEATDARPALQAAFCIDVRSEVFRRALEGVDPGIRTLGFAGFFGVFAKHRAPASDVEELRLPVLLNPTVGSVATAPGDLGQRYAARAKRAWGRFKLAAVSSFAFVEAMGPVYAGKLARDALGRPRPAVPDAPMPAFDPPLD